MTLPDFAPNVHDITGDSKALQVGAWLGENVVGAAIEFARVVTGRDPQASTAERGVKAIERSMVMQEIHVAIASLRYRR